MTRARNRKVTIADIARLAGVSQPTVSRVMNESPLVKKETRERVLEVARKHNYQINANARNLRLRRTMTVAVVWASGPESGQRLSDPFFFDLLGNIADALGEHGYDLLLSTALQDNVRRSEAFLESRKADGLIVIGQGTDDRPLRGLAAAGAPIVVWGAVAPDQPYCTVGGDNAQGGYLATAHLIERGARRLIFLGDISHPEIAMRYRGFKTAIGEQAAEEAAKPAYAHFDTQSGLVSTKEALQHNPEIDGIVASSDAVAMGALAAAAEMGIAVPEQLVVTGYDDISSSAYFKPPLTTIRQDTVLGGKLLAERIIDILAGARPDSATIPIELVVRASSKA